MNAALKRTRLVCQTCGSSIMHSHKPEVKVPRIWKRKCISRTCRGHKRIFRPANPADLWRLR